MVTLAPMDLEFLTNPPESMDYEATFDVAAEEVFDVLADTDKLPLWLADFKSVRWLSDPPQGVGSRREVKLKLLTVEERFVAWDRPNRFAFVMDAISLPLATAMGEDMRIVTTGDERCTLKWRVAYAPTLLSRVARPLATAVFSKLFRDSLAKLKNVVEQRR